MAEKWHESEDSKRLSAADGALFDLSTYFRETKRDRESRWVYRLRLELQLIKNQMRFQFEKASEAEDA